MALLTVFKEILIMPWCPNCDNEYKEGYTVCADCGTELIDDEAYEKLKNSVGEEVSDNTEVSVDINVDAYIPDSYIMNENQKIDIYKRIAGIESLTEKEDMLEELTDRFGNLPRAVINLLDIAYMRVLASTVYVTDIKEESRRVKFSIYENAKYDNTKIAPFIQRFRGAMVLRAGAKPYFLYSFPKGSVYENETLIQLIYDLLKEMQELLEI